MVTPDVHPVCAFHPSNDDAARLARVDAAADRQAADRQARFLRALAAKAPEAAAAIVLLSQPGMPVGASRVAEPERRHHRHEPAVGYIADIIESEPEGLFVDA